MRQHNPSFKSSAVSFKRRLGGRPIGTYAPAYAGLAYAHALWNYYSYRGLDLYEADGMALATADRTIALDPAQAGGYAARGTAMTRAFAPAEPIADDFKRALALQPNSADFHAVYANFLSRQDRNDEALTEVERAVTLDPLAPGIHVGFSAVALAARRYDVAEQEAVRTVALEPNLEWARALEGLSDLLSGKAHRCAMLTLGPYVGVRAMCFYCLGRVREAAQITDSLRAAFTSGTAGDSSFGPMLAARGLAEYYAWTGNAEESLAWLERTYAL